MPSPAQILDGLTRVANDAVAVAIVWHGAIALLAAGLLAGWRPSRQVAAALLAAPVFSAGLVAWYYANPFNAAVLLMLAVGLGAATARLGNAPVGVGPPRTLALGVLMVSFGWIYPHFLDGGLSLRYLYAAPVGLVPCPTLAVTIGFALIWNGVGSPGVSTALGLAGAFYAVFGVFRLGVAIDLVLLVGAAALLTLALAQHEPECAS
jgi:hypothetical protein